MTFRDPLHRVPGIQGTVSLSGPRHETPLSHSRHPHRVEPDLASATHPGRNPPLRLSLFLDERLTGNPAREARDAESGTAVVREIHATCGEAWGPGHPAALFVPTDVTSPADCQGAVTAAMETFGRLDVLVNCIAPGSVETPMLHREWEEMGGEAGVRHLFEEKHPLGRISQPEEVAAAILFLASADASFINGVCLPVDAGLTGG